MALLRPSLRRQPGSGLIPGIPNFEAIYVCLALALMSGGLTKGLVGGNSSVAERMDGDVAFGVVALYIPAYLYAFWTIYRVPYVFLERMKRVGLLWLPIILCVISILWSIAPAATGRRVALLVICAAFSVGLSARLGREGLIRAVGFAMIFVVGVQFLSAIVLPDLGMPHNKFYPAIPGLFTQKNNAGRTLVVGVIAGLALLRGPHNRLGLLILGVSALGTVASLSGTGIVAMVVAIAVYYLLVSLRGAGLFYLGAAAGILGVVILAAAIGTTLLGNDGIYSVLGKDATLSGRTNIWTAIRLALATGNQWWLGYGYEAFFASPKGVGSVDWNMRDYVPPHAHNGMMQTWLNIGVVGVFVTAIGLIFVFVRAADAFGKSNQRIASFDIIFMFYFLMVNITEQTTLQYNNFIWTVFFAIVALPKPALEGGSRLMQELKERQQRLMAQPVAGAPGGGGVFAASREVAGEAGDGGTGAGGAS